MNTPYYLIEERLLRRNLELIRRVADASGAEIILAFKAYALWRTFPILREYISSTTASSPWEARLALEEFGARAHTFSPAYTETDFPELLRCSSHITFNSLSQLHRLRPLVSSYNMSHLCEPVSVGLRINPEHSHIETALYDPCAPGSRFGVLSSDLTDDDVALVDGFHCHCHCESSAEDLEDNLSYIEERFSRWFPRLKWLNLGGGHLMTREGYDTERLIRILRGLQERWPRLHLILEPGSAFGWQTGPLVASVVDVVDNGGIRTAILDVSFTCHMPDCLEMPYKPRITQALDQVDPSFPTYRIGGNSCLSGDFVGDWSFAQPLKPGDQLTFEDMNHYTTVKTNMFNGIQHPSLVLERIDGAVVVMREFSYDDYKNRMN